MKVKSCWWGHQRQKGKNCQRTERYYHSIIFLIFEFLGYYANSEVSTSLSRIDSVVWTNKYIYIFEFEVGDTAQNAIQQIKDKKCIDRYMTDKENGKQIFLISVTCNEKTITNCLIEEI